MQPQRYPDLRAGAALLLDRHWPTLGRYFKRRRLTWLDLPGRLDRRPGSAASRFLRRAARRLAVRSTPRIARLVRQLRE
jgi:hypothetical protein